LRPPMAASAAASAAAAASVEMAPAAATPAPKPRKRRATALEMALRDGGVAGRATPNDEHAWGLAAGVQPEGSKRVRKGSRRAGDAQLPPPPPPPAAGLPPAVPIAAAPAAAKTPWKPGGNRIVDVGALASWVEERTTCKRCATKAVGATLAEFADWVSAHSKADGAKLLKGFHASRSQRGVSHFCGCQQKVVSETRMGVATTLTVQCAAKRPHTQHIELGGRLPDTPKGQHGSYAVNLRYALGCLRTGLGGEQAQTILGTLDVPTLRSYRRLGFKSAEKVLMRALKKCCYESMARAREEAIVEAKAAGKTVR
jgi:hypothetical protein